MRRAFSAPLLIGPALVAAALAAFLLLLPLSARAQGADAPRTVLRLSETAEIAVMPDELKAALAAEARAPTAAAAQAAVNRAVAAALERARAVPGLTIATGQYSVWRVGERGSGTQNPGWQASQAIELTGREAAPLLELAGALQGQGLAVRGLAWQVSRDLHRRTREAATEEATKGLTARAERMAAHLGLVFERFALVDLDPGRAPIPRPMFAAAPMAARADSAPAPSAEPEEVRIGATVSAEALLRPR